MLALSRLTFLQKSISTRAKAVVCKIRYSQASFLKPRIKTSFNLKAEVDRDVVLFSYEKRRFFILLNLFSATQCFFWSYLGVFLFQSIRDPTFDKIRPGFWSRILEKERKHSNILGSLSLVFGFSLVIGTIVYSIRSVRKIILHKGGKDVSIITYNLPGFNTFKVPLTSISATQHRTKAKKFMSLKVKNRFFYFLLDTSGEFSNPALFDFTAGVNRNV